MTRKRFIKLLMSHGEQKHKARAIAFLYHSCGTPYREAYSDYLIKIGINKAFSRLAKAAAELGTSIQKISISLLKLKEAMSND